jgi:hypothetical protein
MSAVVVSEPGTGRPNEDYAAVSAYSAVLVDGASPFGSDSGCVHGVAWFARRLGGALLAAVDDAGRRSLQDCLAEAITHVAGLHDRTCDLSHPGTPSATVVAVRTDGDELDYLVLADSSLILDDAGPEPLVVTDDREAIAGTELRHLMDHPVGTPELAAGARAYVEALAEYRNRPGGFWVASTDPHAAREALTGIASLPDLRAVALLSDGATRLVDRFGLLDWSALCDLLDTPEGSVALIDRTRSAENTDSLGRRWPRAKNHDDATVVWLPRG